MVKDDTSDPRVIALAAVLHTQHGIPHQVRNPTIGSDKDVCDLDAINILAALPADWCGHNEEIWDLTKALDNAEATIARLRTALAAAGEAGE